MEFCPVIFYLFFYVLIIRSSSEDFDMGIEQMIEAYGIDYVSDCPG